MSITFPLHLEAYNCETNSKKFSGKVSRKFENTVCTTVKIFLIYVVVCVREARMKALTHGKIPIHANLHFTPSDVTDPQVNVENDQNHRLQY